MCETATYPKIAASRNLSWQDRAVCAYPIPAIPELGLPERNWESLNHRAQIMVCNESCPVKEQCRAFGNYTNATGVVMGGKFYPVTGGGSKSL